MKVLVTGGFGNIGNNTIHELLAQGHAVRVLDLKTPANQKTAKTWGDRIEVVWGDLTKPDDVAAAVAGVDAVIHLAAIIPPLTEQKPEFCERVNVGGTKNVIAACEAQAHKPRLVFSSSVAVYGPQFHKAPPRRADEPYDPSDNYGRHKVACEQAIHASGLDWVILRLGAVPPVSLDTIDPLMFDVALDSRIEFVHPKDVGLACANAATRDGVVGKTLLIGGGPACQFEYREFLRRALAAMGIPMLPDDCFGPHHFYTDYMDTEESQRLLQYQRYTFDDYNAQVRELLGWRAVFLPLARPFVWRYLRRLSPYWRARRRGEGLPVARHVKTTEEAAR